MRFYSILTLLFFSLLTSMVCAPNVHADFFAPYSKYTRIDSDSLDTGTISVKGEFIFDFIFHKLGENWAVRSEEKLGVNKYFSYRPDLKSDNRWEDTYGQTLLFNVGMKPTDWFFAEFGFAMINDYADRYWIPVNQEHRMERWGERPSQIEWNNAKIGVKNDWASFTYYKNYPHMDWRYDGDLFNLFPVTDSPDDYLRYSGHHTADYWEVKARGIWGDLSVIYGEEALMDYDQGVYVKYRNIFGSNINFYYADHQIPFGNNNVPQWNNISESAQDYGDYRERMRTFELSTDFDILGNTLQMGVMYRPFRLGWDYQYVEDVGTGNGLSGSKYDLYYATTEEVDALGGSAKLSIPSKLGLDLIKLGYEYRGLVAGNRQRADISLEKKLTNYWNAYGGYYYQMPLLGAMPMIYSDAGNGAVLMQGRGPESPFWVWWRNPMTGFDNRETSAVSFVFTYDPTPSTWFYQFEPNAPVAYNLNPEEDAPFSFAVKANFAKYFGTLDRQSYWEYDGSTVWEDVYIEGTGAPDRYIGSLYFLGQFIKGKTKILYDFEVGEDLATLSYPYDQERTREAFTESMLGYFKTSLTVDSKPYLFKLAYIQNLWGPEDWHRNFGSSYDELYLAHISRYVGECFNVGMEYVGARKTNQRILDGIAGDGKTRNEMGYFDEIRVFFKVLFDLTLRFGEKETAAPFIVEYDKTPPQVALKTRPETIYPDKQQKAILEPWVSDHSGVDTWEIYINNEKGDTVTTFSGEKEPPFELEWFGRHEITDNILPDGFYYATLEAKDNYGNIAESETRTIRVMSTPKIKDTQIEETERGLVISFGAKVLFDTAKYNLKPGAAKTLKEVSELLKMYPNNDIAIEGHTDSVGKVMYNQKLSENRANAVKQFLVEQGIEASRMTTVGYGKLKPVADNKTAAGREQNRRVELIILKEGVIAVENVENSVSSEQ